VLFRQADVCRARHVGRGGGLLVAATCNRRGGIG